MERMVRKYPIPKERVDFDTARALMLLGMPQGKTGYGNQLKRMCEPFYITAYSRNWIHKYIPELNIGHIHISDVMCYAPTKKEACEWLLSQIQNKEII